MTPFKVQIRLLIMLAALSLPISWLKAQDTELIQSKLQNIYHFYDSSIYLSFGVTYSFDTDTAYGKSKHETIDGKYTIYGHKCSYRIGTIDYLRNDSFSIAAYNDNKFLNVSRISPVQGSSAVLPSKSVMDSFFSYYAGNYASTLSTIIIKADTFKQIRLIKTENAGDSVLYDSLKIIYNPNSYALHSIEYAFKQPVDFDLEELSEQPVAGPDSSGKEGWAVKFKIAFFDYEAGNISSNTFSTSRLINEDQPGKWIATGKYAGYTIYWSDNRGTKTVNN